MPASLNVRYLEADDLSVANLTRKRSEASAVDNIRGGAIAMLKSAGLDESVLFPDLTERGTVTIVCADSELPKFVAAVSKAVKGMVPRGHIAGTQSVQRFELGGGI